MIEDKKDGIKIAENKEEAFWSQLKEKLISDNENMKRQLELNDYVLKFVETKIK